MSGVTRVAPVVSPFRRLVLAGLRPPSSRGLLSPKRLALEPSCGISGQRGGKNRSSRVSLERPRPRSPSRSPLLQPGQSKSPGQPRFKGDVRVFSGCPDKAPHTERLTRWDLISHTLGAESPRSRRRQGQFPLRPPSLAQRCPSSPRASLRARIPCISSKDTSFDPRLTLCKGPTCKYSHIPRNRGWNLSICIVGVAAQPTTGGPEPLNGSSRGVALQKAPRPEAGAGAVGTLTRPALTQHTSASGASSQPRLTGSQNWHRFGG